MRKGRRRRKKEIGSGREEEKMENVKGGEEGIEDKEEEGVKLKEVKDEEEEGRQIRRQ